MKRQELDRKEIKQTHTQKLKTEPFEKRRNNGVTEEMRRWELVWWTYHFESHSHGGCCCRLEIEVWSEQWTFLRFVGGECMTAEVVIYIDVVSWKCH